MIEFTQAIGLLSAIALKSDSDNPPKVTLTFENERDLDAFRHQMLLGGGTFNEETRRAMCGSASEFGCCGLTVLLTRKQTIDSRLYNEPEYRERFDPRQGG